MLGAAESQAHIELDPYGLEGCSMTKDLFNKAKARPTTAQNFNGGNIKKELQEHVN